MPVEVQELILLDTAVARWTSSNRTVHQVRQELGSVCRLWEVIVNGDLFNDKLTERIAKLLLAGINK